MSQRSAAGLPHATLAGVLNHEVKLPEGIQGIEGGGDLSERWKAAKERVTFTVQEFMNKFDVVLATTEDELEGLLRLARRMDWHPELFDDRGSEHYRQLRARVDSTLNRHGATHGPVDLSQVGTGPQSPSSPVCSRHIFKTLELSSFFTKLQHCLEGGLSHDQQCATV